MLPRHPFTRPSRALSLALATFAALPALATAASSPQPVLLVIANQDFYYRDYAAVRSGLQARGLEVVVAAGEARLAQPQRAGGGLAVQPDRALSNVDAGDYSAIVFVGGWGASAYQYAFGGTYANSAYRPRRATAQSVNTLINEFILDDKPVAAISHGVTTAGGLPGFRFDGVDFPDAEAPVRSQIEWNGATMLTSGSIGNPLTTADDVIVDGRIITAENHDSAARFVAALVQSIGATAD
jgi:putative intracellular protease/amidase